MLQAAAAGSPCRGWYSKHISLHRLILFNLAESAGRYGQNAPGGPVCAPALLPTGGGVHSPTHATVSRPPAGPAFICGKAPMEPWRSFNWTLELIGELG